MQTSVVSGSSSSSDSVFTSNDTAHTYEVPALVTLPVLVLVSMVACTKRVSIQWIAVAPQVSPSSSSRCGNNCPGGVSVGMSARSKSELLSATWASGASSTSWCQTITWRCVHELPDGSSASWNSSGPMSAVV